MTSGYVVKDGGGVGVDQDLDDRYATASSAVNEVYSYVAGSVVNNDDITYTDVATATITNVAGDILVDFTCIIDRGSVANDLDLKITRNAVVLYDYNGYEHYSADNEFLLHYKFVDEGAVVGSNEYIVSVKKDPGDANITASRRLLHLKEI